MQPINKYHLSSVPARKAIHASKNSWKDQQTHLKIEEKKRLDRSLPKINHGSIKAAKGYDYIEDVLDDEEKSHSSNLVSTLDYSKPVRLIPLTSESTYFAVSRTKSGSQGHHTKINQDVAMVEMKLPFGLKLFCVCDGHGLNGHRVSAFIKTNLLKNLMISLKKCPSAPETAPMQELLYFCLIKTNEQLLSSEINTELSGSTLIAVFVYLRSVFVFNVGDSRAILLKQIPTLIDYQLEQANPPRLSKSKKKEKYQWEIEALSKDQKPQRKDEAERILRAGGRIQGYVNAEGNFIGPLRVWMKEVQLPGLAMTRSFGDKAGLKAGTCYQPEIIQHLIRNEDKFIVVASDGVWQYMQNQDVLAQVIRSLPRQQLPIKADAVVKQAYLRWEKRSESRDDITVIVIRMNEVDD